MLPRKLCRRASRLDMETQDTDHLEHLSRLKKLDDFGFAQKFTDEKLDRAKELIAQILMVTSGVCVVNERSTFGEDNLLELLDMFQIRHDNFSASTFAENLQFHIFTFTSNHDDAYREWRKDVFAKQGMNDNGDETGKFADAPKDEQPAGSQELDKLAASISEVLQNPSLPVELYNAILHGTDDIINASVPEVSERFETSPEHIKAVLKMRSNE